MLFPHPLCLANILRPTWLQRHWMQENLPAKVKTLPGLVQLSSYAFSWVLFGSHPWLRSEFKDHRLMAKLHQSSASCHHSSYRSVQASFTLLLQDLSKAVQPLPSCQGVKSAVGPLLTSQCSEETPIWTYGDVHILVSFLKCLLNSTLIKRFSSHYFTASLTHMGC